MFCKQQQYTSTQNNPSAIPGVLKARLLTSGSLIFGILAAGIFMEYQMGAGFLTLSCLCSVCFGIRFLILFSIIYCRKYEVMEGEIIRIQKDRVRKKSWELIVRERNGEEKQILISSLHNIRKGMTYWFYWKGSELLGIEEKRV